MALSWQIECADNMNEEAQLCKTRLTQRSEKGGGGQTPKIDNFNFNSVWICHWQNYDNFIMDMLNLCLCIAQIN